MSQYIKEFSKNSLPIFKKFEKQIDENDWSDIINYSDSDSKKFVDGLLESKKELAKLQFSLAETIASRLKTFNKKAEADKNTEAFKKVMRYGISIIEKYTDRVDNYCFNLDLDKIPTVGSRTNEVEFTKDLFKWSSNLGDKLADLNFSESDDMQVGIKFYGDVKATLPMHDFIVEDFPEIKDKLAALGIDFDSEPKNEMYINIENPPKYNPKKHYWEQEKETIQFWLDELKKCKNGVYIDGVYIAPWTYYHINHFTTRYPSTKVNKHTGEEEAIDIIGTPPLRDNEWMLIQDTYLEAKKQGKMMFVAATRRAAKTTMLASHLGWCATIGKKQLLCASGSSKDLGQIRDYFLIDCQNKNHALRVTQLTNDWEKFVDFGVKNMDGKNKVMTSIKVINMDAGGNKSSEVLAGYTPDALIIDEVMKLPFKEQLAAAKPALDQPGGKRCVAILTGCVCKGTKVLASDGRLLNIEDINKEDGILGVDEKGISKEPITWIKPPAKKDCYRIETTGGNYLECSDDHPILTSNNGEGLFEQAKKIKPGNTIYMPDSVPVFGKKHEKNARLLGLLVGDGYNGVCGSELYIVSDNVFNWLGNNYEFKVLKEQKTKDGSTYRRIYINKSSEITRNSKINNITGVNKKLPFDWDLYNKESLSELIAGLIDSDGSVSKTRRNIRIRYSSISYNVVESLRFALLKFGIHCTVSVSKRYDTIIKGIKYNRKPIFELSISRLHDVRVFIDNIKLLSENKQISQEDLDFFTKTDAKKSLKTIKTTYGDKGAYFLNKEQITNLRPVKVKSVKYIGKKDVYNLTAGVTHTYLANGFITHNTAGNSDLAKDAFSILRDPESNDILHMDYDILDSRVPEKDRTYKRIPFGTFIPGQMSAKDGCIKQDSNLADFLKISDSNKLRDIKIKTTNWELANKVIKNDRDKKKKDAKEYIKEVLYFPICPSELFLSTKTNPFNPELLSKVKEDLLQSGNHGKKVTLHETNSGIYYEETNKSLAEYPHKGGFVDAPIVLFEEIPEETPPDFLYVAGFDDYKQEESDTDSVGAFYIYKVNIGMIENAGTIVASIATRPNPHSSLHEQIFLLQKAFNAKCFMENADDGYKQFLDRRRLADRWLYTSIDFKSDIAQNGMSRRKFGWTPTPQNIKFLKNLLITYINEDIEVKDENDVVISSYKGGTRIKDLGLLEELINYSESANVDRVTAFMSCLGIEYYLHTNWMLPTLSSFKKNKEVKQKRQELESLATRMYGNSTRQKRYF